MQLRYRFQQHVISISIYREIRFTVYFRAFSPSTRTLPVTGASAETGAGVSAGPGASASAGTAAELGAVGSTVIQGLVSELV